MENRKIKSIFLNLTKSLIQQKYPLSFISYNILNKQGLKKNIRISIDLTIKNKHFICNLR